MRLHKIETERFIWVALTFRIRFARHVSISTPARTSTENNNIIITIAIAISNEFGGFRSNDVVRIRSFSN